MKMLVLTRRLGQEIVIGPDVHIVVTEIRRGQVRLGIVAPPSVRVHRMEVLERQQEVETRAAEEVPV